MMEIMIKYTTNKRKDKHMRIRILILLLPMLATGCGERRLVDAPLGEDEFVEIAIKEVSEINSCEIGELSARFDVGNKEWLEIDEESARFFHEHLDNRSYQAVHVGYKEPHIGGGCTVLMDKGTGRVITFSVGL